MTETTGTTPAPDEGTPERPERRRLLLAAMAAGVAALAIGVAGFAAWSNDADPQPVASGYMAAGQACHEGPDGDYPGRGPGAGGCDDMAGRMSGPMGDGRMMMGSGMRGNAGAMRDGCTLDE